MPPDYRFDDGSPDKYTDAKMGCAAVAALAIVALVWIVLIIAVALAFIWPRAASADVGSDLLTEHNRCRKARGREPLFANPKLTAAAQKHADWMARNNRMSHYGPGRNTWMERATAAGYAWGGISENVAYGYDDAADVTGGWMRSPGHRSNILSRTWRDVGFGFARGRSGRLYWCAVYARPRSVVR